MPDEFSPPVSVVVPAHNESQVIARTLRVMIEGLAPGSEIIVVCNGCTDDTAQVASGVHGPVRVLEIGVGSKIAALNAGDEVAAFFPRFYVDADVLIAGRSLTRMAQVMRHDQLLAASPALNMDVSHSSWPVRCYYRLWSELAYVRQGMIGVGVYALSQAGRSRFEQFPAITADDGYVRLLFDPQERPVIQGCASQVTAPATLRGLLAIKTRSRFGNREMRHRFPELFERQATRKRHGSALLEAVRRSRAWGCLPFYLYVTLGAAWCGRWKTLMGRQSVWERDDSSRQSLGQVEAG